MARAVIAGAVCAAAVAGMLTPAEAAVPDLSGFWARTTFGMEPPASGQGPIQPMNRRRADGSRIDSPQFNVGDDSSPILKPAAAAAVRKRNEMQRQGVDYPSPSNQCTPMIAPYAFRVQGMQVLQTKDEVMFLYMQDHQVRHVRLNAQHPQHVVPSWNGDSVGRYEGDTLVIDTVGIKTRSGSLIDMYGTPHSPALHVIERYRLVDAEAAAAAQARSEKEYGRPTTEPVYVDFGYKGKGLEVKFTVEDPGVFTTDWSSSVTYRRSNSEWLEIVCAENLENYYPGATTTVPKVDRPDF